MRKKIYIEVNGGCVVSVYSKDFEVTDLEFCVVDRDMRHKTDEDMVINDLFDVIAEDMIEFYETEEVS